jgi:hypothetical protein
LHELCIYADCNPPPIRKVHECYWQLTIKTLEYKCTSFIDNPLRNMTQFPDLSLRSNWVLNQINTLEHSS